MTTNLICEVLDEFSAVADFYLDLADRLMAERDYNGVLTATHVAAWLLRMQNRDLTSARVEANFQRVAAAMPLIAKPRRKRSSDATGKEAWLHVLTNALPHGGHSVLPARWMQDDFGRRHSLALLGQRQPVPTELAESVQRSGGEIHLADQQETLLHRAAWLRELAFTQADYVVLHIDVDDVVAPTAFGGAGGPPVLLLNHAAHIFWTGSSIIDLAINCRGSQLETEWTRRYRGIARCATIPIPLRDSDRPTEAARTQARESLGIAKDEIFILTSGDSYKYTPANGLDFVATCQDLLRSSPSLRIMALGAAEDARWKRAREDSNGRLKTVGRQPRERVPVFLQAADIYIEGFPFGSTTALLEAGLLGIPAVLAPQQCPPPYGTDGVAVDLILERPGTVADYQAKILQLVREPQRRIELGAALSSAIKEHHLGAGWKHYIERTTSAVPQEHEIHPPATPLRTSPADYEYWTRFCHTIDTPMIPESSVSYAATLGFDGRFADVLTKELRRRGNAGKPERLSDHVWARMLVAMGDHYRQAGSLAAARECYSDALCWNPRLGKVRAKRLLLSLGKTGQGLMACIRRLKNLRGAAH